jgi:hypothetical protein
MGLTPFRGAIAAGGAALDAGAPTWLPQLAQNAPVTGFPQLPQKAIATNPPTPTVRQAIGHGNVSKVQMSRC